MCMQAVVCELGVHVLLATQKQLGETDRHDKTARTSDSWVFMILT
jgi:hypothetical protein